VSDIIWTHALAFLGGAGLATAVVVAWMRAVVGRSDEVVRRAHAANDELRVANVELDAFAYAASHDLKAPLVSIDGMAAALERHASDVLDDRARHYLGRIRANATTLRDLIDDVLEYARAGAAEPLRAIDADALAREVVAELRAAAEERASSLELTTTIAPVRGHPVRFKQALANVVTNAVVHGGAERPVAVTITAATRNGHVEIAVEDDGAGVPSETREQMFDLFAKGARGGTGVGLALAKRITESAGGSIRYEARPDGGSRFVLTFERGDSQ
jgi:signal transduction histidine kinase